MKPMDCAQKGISARRHSVHHWDISPLAICPDNSSSETGTFWEYVIFVIGSSRAMIWLL